jgi:hypothetical protein
MFWTIIPPGDKIIELLPFHIRETVVYYLVYKRPHILDDPPIQLNEVGVGYAHQINKVSTVKHEILNETSNVDYFQLIGQITHHLHDFKRINPLVHKLAALLRVLQHHVFGTQQHMISNNVSLLDSLTVRKRLLSLRTALCMVNIRLNLLNKRCGLRQAFVFVQSTQGVRGCRPKIKWKGASRWTHDMSYDRRIGPAIPIRLN